MKQTFKRMLTFIGLSAMLAQNNAANAASLAPFPKAEPGFIRQVIHLPQKAEEHNFKVQVMAGKILEVDCNSASIYGNLTAVNLSGWGYLYYHLKQPSVPIPILKACPDRTTRKKFVEVRGDGFLLGYNSRLPIVLYVPEDFEVRYRLWSASTKVKTAVTE